MNTSSTLSEFVSNPTTTRTTTNITNSLVQSLTRKYKLGYDLWDIVQKIMAIHGLSNDKFDFVGNLNKVLCNRLNDVSIDDNSNKVEKTFEGLIQEVVCPIKKSVGYDFLYQTMRKIYGKEEAKRLSGELYDFSLSLNDSTKILIPYCYSFNASNIILNGRKFGQLYSNPPKRIESYIACLNETIHQMSHHVAGALAVSTIFIDFCHILLIKEKIPYYDIINNMAVRKRIENAFQMFVHSVNHLSRNSIESPFSNISIFDRPKLRALIEGMKWYFNDLNTNNVIEYIIAIQDIFLDFFDKGDPSKNGLLYRFPICTVNISKKKKDNEWVVEDDKFLESIVKRDIFRYNIFSSEGIKIASCCFRGDQQVETMINRDGVIYADLPTFKELIDDIDDCNDRRVYYNGWKHFDKVKIGYNDDWIEIVCMDGKKITCTKDHYFPCLSYEEGLIRYYEYNKRAEDLTSNDYLKTCCSFIKIKKVNKVQNNEGVAYCINIRNGEPYFTLANGIITHNCRLINDTEMYELGGTINSFGGSAISMGSHRVVTININRIALEAKTLDDYYAILKERVRDTAKILKAHKELINMTTKEGIQMFIKMGWIAMSRMFSTFGILGIVEAKENLEKKFGNNGDYIEETLKLMNKLVFEYSKKYGIYGNIEQIPGESMAVRFAEVDRLLFGDEAIPQKIYSNQFVPLWENSTIWERMAEDGKYNQLITGGGIVHVQVGEKTTSQQSKKIIKYAIKVGNEHFALNAIYTEFQDGSFMLGKYKINPQSGSPAREYYTRVVGFFTPVGSWNKVRREWEFPQRKFNGVDV